MSYERQRNLDPSRHLCECASSLFLLVPRDSLWSEFGAFVSPVRKSLQPLQPDTGAPAAGVALHCCSFSPRDSPRYFIGAILETIVSPVSFQPLHADTGALLHDETTSALLRAQDGANLDSSRHH